MIEGSSLREEDKVIKPTTEEVIEAVQSGEADAAFVSRDLSNVVQALQQVSPYLDRCTLGGASLMCRKDSHLPNWWNPAWRRLLNSPRHEEFCDRIDTIYNRFGQSSAEFCLTR
ncbi:uncharacterized protein [Amphiura filiformis]|uniref:uncharacterized protein isoform X2 n=1 Tax=Amphiura filiformis TaxID=82378 RepID=UPI003B212DF9